MCLLSFDMRKDKNEKIYREDSLYHIYNRGNHKEKIYFQEDDYKLFRSLMFKYLKKYRLLVMGYCYLPNHYHLVVKGFTNLNAIPKFMGTFMTVYVMYFNRKYNKVGRLFQGPFQIRRLRGKKDCKTVLNYLRNNPVEAGLCKIEDIDKYPWLYIRKGWGNPRPAP